MNCHVVNEISIIPQITKCERFIEKCLNFQSFFGFSGPNQISGGYKNVKCILIGSIVCKNG